MAELMFGVTHKDLSFKAIRKLDRIAKELGAYGFQWARLSDGPRGWFTGPNRGYPWDRELRLAVLKRVEQEGIIL